MGELNRRLKALRAQAQPPISLSGMANALDLESRQAYHFYESDNGFKQRFLPMDLARRIAAVLQDHGVNPDDVLALAGIGIDEASSPALSAGEERLLDSFRQLDADQRRLLLQLADQMHAASYVPPAERATVHGGRRGYRSQQETRANRA